MSGIADGKKEAEKKLKEGMDRLNAMISEMVSKGFEGDLVKYSAAENRPTVDSVREIVNGTANTCAGISGGAALIPGPLGALSIIPDIATTMKFQVAMVAKIAVAYGKQNVATKELLLYLLAGGVGKLSIATVVVRGGRTVVKRQSARMIQKIIVFFGGKVLQRTVKKMAARFVPIVGAGAMAVWTHYMTRKIGERAIAVFSGDIVIEEDDGSILSPESDNIENAVFEDVPELSVVEQVKRLKWIIKISKSDGIIHDNKRRKIDAYIEKAKISKTQKNALRELMDDSADIAIALPSANGIIDAIDFLTELIAVAKADGDFSKEEKKLVAEVAHGLGVAQEDLDILY